MKDAQWLLQGDLKPVDINQISPSQFVVYRFGVFTIRMLAKCIGTPEVCRSSAPCMCAFPFSVIQCFVCFR